MGVFTSLSDKKREIFIYCIFSFYFISLIVGSIFALSESTLFVARGFVPFILLMTIPILFFSGKLLPDEIANIDLNLKAQLSFVPLWLKVLTIAILVYEIVILIILESSFSEVNKLQMAEMKMGDLLHYFGLFMFLSLVYFSFIQAHLKCLEEGEVNS